MKKTKTCHGLLLLIAGLPLVAAAGTRDDINELQIGQLELQNRLESIESRIQNQGLLEMMQTLDNLQIELRELRGHLEQQTFELEGIRKRQRELYLDIDRRLSEIQLHGAADVAPVAAPAIAASTVDKATTPNTISNTTAVANSSQERTTYKAAFQLLREAQYSQAIEAFTAFLKKHPDGSYADNAQYWLGEANYVSRNFNRALKEFNKVIQNYPRSPKVPDAKLKIGYTYYELQQWDSAREMLVNITANHKNSSVAPLASQRLQRLSQEGR